MSLLFVLLSASPLGSVPATQPAALIEVAERPGLPAQRKVHYRWSQVWRTAMRMIRVDKGWQIDDHSEEAGYLLFHDPSDASNGARGSIELVATADKESGQGLLIRAKVSNAGTHAAFTLLSALALKLRADYGVGTTGGGGNKGKPGANKDKGVNKNKNENED